MGRATHRRPPLPGLPSPPLPQSPRQRPLPLSPSRRAARAPVPTPVGTLAARTPQPLGSPLPSPPRRPPARPQAGPGRRPSTAPGSPGGHGRTQAGGMGPGRGQPLRRAASNKDRTAEHTYQSQHRAQQGVSDQHFQIQVFSGHQWAHHHPKEC